MARKHFYELLSEMSFDYNKEFDRLCHLVFIEKTVWNGSSWASFSKYIDKVLFRNFKYRGPYLSFDDMLKAIFFRFPNINSLDDLLLFCEIIISIIKDGKYKIHHEESAKKQSQTISDNIDYICEKTNHEIIEKSKDEFIIVEKNKEAKQAAELIEDTSVAIELLEYNHYALRGDLDEKCKILTSLGNYIEPILKSRLLQQNGYGKLESDTGFLLNSFNIRHNNKTGAKAQEYITQINDSKLEEWYDKCYNSILAVIIIKEQIQTTKELNELKNNYKWKY